MIFTVTYRAKDGALREERIEAADRAGCVAECRRRGIAPVLVAERSTSAKTGSGLRRTSGRGGRDKEERTRGRDGARPSRERRVRDNAPYHGANGQDARFPSQRAGRPLSQWIVAVLIAAATAGGVWWWMGGRGVARPSLAEKPGAGNAADASKTMRGNGRASAVTRRSFIAKKEAVKTSKVEKPSIADADVFFVPKTQGRVVTWKIDNPPVFTNQFEGFVADVLTSVPGERFLDESNLDDGFDEAFFESLKSEIVKDKGDSEVVAALKDAVIAVKKEVQERVAAGERPRDVVLAARDELNKIADYRDKIQAAFNEYLLGETDPKEVMRFAQEANALLDEYGAQHIEGPHDEETAQEMLISAKEEKVQELQNELSKEEKKNEGR